MKTRDLAIKIKKISDLQEKVSAQLQHWDEPHAPLRVHVSNEFRSHFDVVNLFCEEYREKGWRIGVGGSKDGLVLSFSRR